MFWNQFPILSQARTLAMARPESRFIETLTKSQVQHLEELRDRGNNSRIRHRAHAVLLSFNRTSVNELVKIFQSNRNTIVGWLDRWETEGFDGMADKPRCGAPTKLNPKQQSRALKILQETPQSTNTALIKLKQETGIEISGETMKRLAKKNGLVWKRMRKSLRSKRDQKKFATSAGVEATSTRGS